jgi:uncharacterized protein YbjT (DUF2867 family)
MILVAGSTGLVGSEICRQLTAQQKKVRALVRKTSAPEKIDALKQMGCSLTEGDFKDRASLDIACKDCDTVITTVSSTISHQEGDNIQTVDHDGNLSLVAAAKEAGVKHFIFISGRFDMEIGLSLVTAKRATEQAIINSGMNFSILKASFFMEIWLGPILGFNYPEHKAQVYGDGQSAVSYVSYKDVAAFAAGSVDNPAALNSVIEVGGPEALSQVDVVKIFEHTSGVPFEVQYIPQNILKQQMDEAPDPLQRLFAGMMLMYTMGNAMEMTDSLQKIPVELHSVRDYANTVMQKEAVTV